MVKRWIEKVTGPFEDKRRYRQYKERVKQLPPSYRTTVEALDRYLMYRGAITNGDVLMEMAEDLADRFGRSSARTRWSLRRRSWRTTPTVNGSKPSVDD